MSLYTLMEHKQENYQKSEHKGAQVTVHFLLRDFTNGFQKLKKSGTIDDVEEKEGILTQIFAQVQMYLLSSPNAH